MVRFKKYWYYKYPYHICLDIKDLPNNIVGKRFEIVDNSVKFITNKKGIELLNSLNIYYELNDTFKKKLRTFLLRRLVGIISFVIILFLMFFSNHYVREIKFENDLYYNEEVYEYVKGCFKKVGNIYLVNKSLNNVSIDLKNEFNYYAFIGLIKEGGILKIKIIPNVKINKNEQHSNLGLYASKNAYIVYINIDNGKNLVNYQQMVKKGDLLVGGENCSGIIIGRTIDIETFIIKKEQELSIYTNNYYKDRYFQIFNYNNENKKSKYKNYYVDKKIIIDLYFFKVYENTYYEKVNKNEIVNIDLIKYNINKLYEKEFYQIKRNKKEKVINVEILNIEEDKEFFYLKLLTIKYENIVRE
mgnify:CR=1 FL=1